MIFGGSSKMLINHGKIIKIFKFCSKSSLLYPSHRYTKGWIFASIFIKFSINPTTVSSGFDRGKQGHLYRFINFNLDPQFSFAIGDINIWDAEIAGYEIKEALATRETEKILLQSRCFSFREALFRRLYKKVKQKRARRKKKYEEGAYNL